MIPGINNSILQFFDNEADRHHMKEYSQGLIHPVMCYIRRMPPWQIIRETGAGAGTTPTVILESLNPSQSFALNMSGGLPVDTSLETTATGDVIVYKGVLNVTTGTSPIGHYKVTVTDTFGNTFYSEIFAMVDDLAPLLKITWWHSVDMPIPNGTFIFANGFKNIMYFKSDLGKPNYEINRRVLPRKGTIMKINQRWKKVFNTSLMVTEGMADVITMIGLHHYVQIEYRGKTYTVHDFLPSDPKWEKEGDVGNIDCRIEIGAISSQTGNAQVQAEHNNDFGDDFTVE